jgi:hypothetical protein
VSSRRSAHLRAALLAPLALAALPRAADALQTSFAPRRRPSPPEQVLFERPLRMRADEELIDVTNGHAAPFPYDLDGDGLVDLLVGEAGQHAWLQEAGAAEGARYVEGRLRYYRNAGTKERPRYGAWTHVRAGERPAAVPVQSALGFVPRLRDLNGDGIEDLLSGSETGQVFAFLATARGQFAEPVELRLGNGERFVEGAAVSVDAGDFDQDGDLDLVLATEESELYVVENQGTARAPDFADFKARIYTEEGRPMWGTDVHAVDWDGDGRLDVLLGTAAGGVAWHRNLREEGRIRISPAIWLLPEPASDEPQAEGAIPRHPGQRVKVSTGDWDGDGKLDLLLGDFSVQLAISDQIPPAQAATLRRLQGELRQAQRDYERGLDELRNAPAPPPMPALPPDPPSKPDPRPLVYTWWWWGRDNYTPLPVEQPAIPDLPAGTAEGAPDLGRMFAEVGSARERVEALAEEIRANTPEEAVYHGWVWVYRRR